MESDISDAEPEIATLLVETKVTCSNILLDDDTMDFLQHISRHEIGDVIRSLLPTSRIISARKYLHSKIQDAVNEALPTAIRVDVFGSCAQKLSTITSDMDLVICFEQAEDAKKALSKLAKVLRRRVYKGKVRTIFNARIPIIQYYCFETKFPCDIKISNDDVHMFKANFLKTIVTSDDRVKPFLLFIKHWAKSRNLGDASRGTLNTLGHTLLGVHFLQYLERPVAPRLECDPNRCHWWMRNQNVYNGWGAANNPRMTIGELLLRFFDFYQNFPFRTHAVSVREGRPIVKSDVETHEKQRRNWIIQDPHDPKDNVARNLKPSVCQLLQDEFNRAFKIFSEKKDIRLLFQEPVPPKQKKNDEIFKYVRQLKKENGTTREDWDTGEVQVKAADVLKVSKKRILKIVNQVYGTKKQRGKKDRKRNAVTQTDEKASQKRSEKIKLRNEADSLVVDKSTATIMPFMPGTPPPPAASFQQRVQTPTRPREAHPSSGKKGRGGQTNRGRGRGRGRGRKRVHNSKERKPRPS